MAILRLENLTKRFGGVDVLRDVTFHVEAGERLLIIGPNGAGKTTLFNLIGGQLPPTSGKIIFEDRDITNFPAHQRAHMGIVRSFQLLTLLPNLSVVENALLTFHGNRKSRLEIVKDFHSFKEVNSKVEEALYMAGLWDTRNEPVQLLSYGQQRKLEVVLSMVLRPKLLLLDEPTNGLTNEESAEIVKLIHQLGKDVTMLVVAHDMDFVFEVAERISVLYYGGLVADGCPEEIRNNVKVKEIYLGVGGI